MIFQLMLYQQGVTNISKQACVGLVERLLRYHWWLILVVVFLNCLWVALTEVDDTFSTLGGHLER